MGNRALLSALDELSRDSSVKAVFDQLILAAPDLSEAQFAQVQAHFKRLSQRATIYASPSDKALALSAALHNDE